MSEKIPRDPALTGIRATLASCRLFDGLPDADLGEIAGFAQLVRLEKDAVLFREGEPSRGFFVVQTGMVMVHRMDERGREQVIHQLLAGDSFAEASMTAPKGYPADARALSSATVVCIPKAAFLAALARNPELALRILASMSRHVRALVDRMRSLNTRDAEARLAAYLITLPRDAAGLCVLPTTRRVLAATLGMAEETLSRAFARLTQAGMITARARRVTVIDAPALFRRAES